MSTTLPAAGTPSDWHRVLSWLHQPTTVAGLAALAGDAAMIVTGAASWRLELPLACGSLVAMALPDNSVATSIAIRTLRDLLTALQTKDPKAIAAAIADGQALVQALSRQG